MMSSICTAHILICAIKPLYTSECALMWFKSCGVFVSFPHHGHPSQGRDALADGRQVIEEAAATAPLPEGLDLLDVISDGLQQVLQLRLRGVGTKCIGEGE